MKSITTECNFLLFLQTGLQYYECYELDVGVHTLSISGITTYHQKCRHREQNLNLGDDHFKGALTLGHLHRARVHLLPKVLMVWLV